MITLVKNGNDLAERLNTFRDSVQRVFKHRRKALNEGKSVLSGAKFMDMWERMNLHIRVKVGIHTHILWFCIPTHLTTKPCKLNGKRSQVIVMF